MRPQQSERAVVCVVLRVPGRQHVGKPHGVCGAGRVSTLALPFGVSASVAILAFQAGIRHGDIATSWLAINLSSGVPTVASILIYQESPGLETSIALCLIPLSMALLWKDKRERRSSWLARPQKEKDRDTGTWLRLMLVAFAANGLGPFGLKVLTARSLGAHRSQYLLYWYLGRASVCCGGVAPEPFPGEWPGNSARRPDGRMQPRRPEFHRPLSRQRRPGHIAFP